MLIGAIIATIAGAVIAYLISNGIQTAAETNAEARKACAGIPANHSVCGDATKL